MLAKPFGVSCSTIPIVAAALQTQAAETRASASGTNAFKAMKLCMPICLAYGSLFRHYSKRPLG